MELRTLLVFVTSTVGFAGSGAFHGFAEYGRKVAGQALPFKIDKKLVSLRLTLAAAAVVAAALGAAPGAGVAIGPATAGAFGPATAGAFGPATAGVFGPATAGVFGSVFATDCGLV